MAKFHVNKSTGDVGKCRAKKGNCPFGGEDEHYASAHEAQRVYESSRPALASVKRSKAAAPTYSTTEKSFEGASLREQASLYRILTDMGVEYLPWRGREQELNDALRRYDESTKGSPIEGSAYKRSETQAGREAMARYRATVVRRGGNDKDCYRLIPRDKPEHSSLFKRVFSKD